MIVTRFAPSPTGRLHLGHAFSAVTGHDLARQEGDRWAVRIEDLDQGRSRPEFVEGIFDDLAWLGLEWDEVAAQSGRIASYAAAADRLKAEGYRNLDEFRERPTEASLLLAVRSLDAALELREDPALRRERDQALPFAAVGIDADLLGMDERLSPRDGIAAVLRYAPRTPAD